MRFSSRSRYLFGNTKHNAKLNRLKRKGWLNQPDQHVLDWLTHKMRKAKPDAAPAHGSSS